MVSQRPFQKYEQLIHPYSGLDPESWKRFSNNLRAFEKSLDGDLDKAATFLYHSIENIRDMSMGIRTSSDGTIQEILQRIGNDLGFDGEFAINQNAIKKGLRFFPKYLNERFDDYSEDGIAFIPSTVRSHGQ